MGRNGSGKSTWLGIAAGTIAPTSGVVERYVNPTLLFTVGTAFDDELSGSENARLELLLRGVSGRHLRTRLAQAREFAEIDDAWDEPLRTYSAGMRARTALAAALANPGPLLLVDEILSVGDAGFVAKCIHTFQALRAGGASLLFVSHDPKLADVLADEAIVLDHGRSEVRGSLADARAAYTEILSAQQRPVELPAGS
jgi:lipopolysaccharide transport system ATP-binding protein